MSVQISVHIFHFAPSERLILCMSGILNFKSVGNEHYATNGADRFGIVAKSS